MDFLDPIKIKKHNIRLMVGYVLLGIVVLLATIVLLYQAFGYSIDRHGRVIQNGLVYISSSPTGAKVFIDGEEKSDNTNTRFLLPAGKHVFEVKRNGYLDWKRAITVEGGTVQRFDYPFLFPADLESASLQQYAATPSLFTQSPDRRWLFTESGEPDVLDLYDLSQASPQPIDFKLPIELLAAGSTTTAWGKAEWASERHMIIRREFQKDGQAAAEYLIIDREDANQSQNLSVIAGFTPTKLRLRGGDYDRYYALDAGNGSLFTMSLAEPTPQLLLENVLEFTIDGEGRLLYVTPDDSESDTVAVKLKDGDNTYTIRKLAAQSAPYLISLGGFERNLLVAVGSSLEGRIYVYRNPADTLSKDSNSTIVPVHVLKVPQAAQVLASPNGRYFFAQNGADFAVYDVKINRGYNYKIDTNDEPVKQAIWMDGFHIQTLVGSQVNVFDYDGANQRRLVDSAHLPTLYGPDYRRAYSIDQSNNLQMTHLLVDQDR